jgi:hypothetical protein
VASGAVKRKLVEFVNRHYLIQIRGSRPASAGVLINRMLGRVRNKYGFLSRFVAACVTTNELQLLSLSLSFMSVELEYFQRAFILSSLLPFLSFSTLKFFFF